MASVWPQRSFPVTLWAGFRRTSGVILAGSQVILFLRNDQAGDPSKRFTKGCQGELSSDKKGGPDSVEFPILWSTTLRRFLPTQRGYGRFHPELAGRHASPASSFWKPPRSSPLQPS